MELLLGSVPNFLDGLPAIPASGRSCGMSAARMVDIRSASIGEIRGRDGERGNHCGGHGFVLSGLRKALDGFVRN